MIKISKQSFLNLIKKYKADLLMIFFLFFLLNHLKEVFLFYHIDSQRFLNIFLSIAHFLFSKIVS